MRLDVPLRWWAKLSAGERLAVAAWVVLLLAVVVRLNIAPPWKHNLYPTFRLAAENWCAGDSLYRTVDDRTQPDVYRYSPTVAPAFVPLMLLPDRLASVVWRFVNAAVLLGGLAAWLRWVVPLRLRVYASLFFLLLLPLAAGSLNNGQSNPTVLGLLLLAVAAAVRDRWTTAAVCLTAAILFKVYPISLALLLVVALPPAFAPRLLLAVFCGFALPFLLQQPAYVWEQYRSWIGYLGLDDRTVFPVELVYRDLRLLFRVWLWPLSPTAYLTAQLVMAGAAAVLCLLARRAGWPRSRLLNLALGLACVWMTVFGAASESPTYLLLGPSMILVLVEVWREPRSVALRGLALAAYALLTATQLANWYAPLRYAFHPLGPHPLSGLLFLAALLGNEYRWFKALPSPSPTPKRVEGAGKLFLFLPVLPSLPVLGKQLQEG